MLAGGVSVGRQTHVAIGAKVIPQINIGQDCVIGAGATVINDIESYQTVVGTPQYLRSEYNWKMKEYSCLDRIWAETNEILSTKHLNKTGLLH